MKTFLELARNRYSVRDYSSRTIEPAVLTQVLEAGRVAPTAHNNQPQRVKIITEPEDLRKVDSCTPCRFGAPVVLLVCYDQTACWDSPFDGTSSGDIDAAIYLTHLMLAAHDLGLGTCIVKFFESKRVVKKFLLPENIVPVAMLTIGYPAEDAKAAALHYDRFELDRFIFE